MAAFTGMLEPSEFFVVQGVFNRIRRDVTFGDDWLMLEWLGRFVLNAYQGGMVDDERLYEHCLGASQSANESQSFDVLRKSTSKRA